MLFTWYKGHISLCSRSLGNNWNKRICLLLIIDNRIKLRLNPAQPNMITMFNQGPFRWDEVNPASLVVSSYLDSGHEKSEVFAYLSHNTLPSLKYKACTTFFKFEQITKGQLVTCCLSFKPLIQCLRRFCSVFNPPLWSRRGGTDGSVNFPTSRAAIKVGWGRSGTCV